jgi:hypothetical protein
LTKLKVEKDRHGHVRGHATAGVIALAHIVPDDDGATVTVTLEPPDTEDDAGRFRPTNLMEKASRLVEEQPGIGTNELLAGVRGKAQHVRDAARCLIAEDFVRPEQDGQKRRHFSITPFRQDTNRVPTSQPSPNHVPDAGVTNRVPASPPLQRDADSGPGQGHTHTTHQDPDAELERITAKYGDPQDLEDIPF